MALEILGSQVILPFLKNEEVNNNKSEKLAVLPDIPAEIWKIIFEFASIQSNYTPYQNLKLNLLSPQFIGLLKPVKQKFIYIDNQKLLDDLLNRRFTELPDLFLSEGTFTVNKIDNLNVKIYGGGIRKTFIKGGILCKYSRLEIYDLSICDAGHGLVSYSDFATGKRTFFNISIFLKRCELFNCNVILFAKNSWIDMNNCYIHSNLESFHFDKSLIHVNDSEYYHSGGSAIKKNTEFKNINKITRNHLVFENTKIVHCLSPLTPIDHTLKKFEYEADVYNYVRPFVVESNKPIWQVWFNNKFTLENRLSFVLDDEKVYEQNYYAGAKYTVYGYILKSLNTENPENSVLDDEKVYEQNYYADEDYISNETKKSDFIAVTDLDKKTFCYIIQTLLNTIDDLSADQIIFFKNLSESMIHLICIYVNIPSNQIENVPEIMKYKVFQLFKNLPNYKIFDKFEEYDNELFLFVKELFVSHGFNIIGTGDTLGLCRNDYDGSRIIQKEPEVKIQAPVEFIFQYKE